MRRSLFIILSLVAVNAWCQTPRVNQTVETLLGQMTTTEKIQQLAASTLYTTADNTRLGIAGFKMLDGPHGVHKKGFTSFPTSIAMAAMWDRQMTWALGRALGEEFWSDGQNVGLAPCIDLILDPRQGRAAEGAGEDPYLSGQLGVNFVRGLQQTPVIACLKHFEIEGKQAYRTTCNEIIEERDLMGHFGVNFRTALQEGVPLSLMSSYNLINGVQATANRHLLTDILRQRWGFPFMVVSDWNAVKDGVASVIAGTDVCMGSTHYSAQLPSALTNGKLTEAQLDTAVRRVLSTKLAAGLTDYWPAPAQQMIDTEEHRQLCRAAVQKSIVMLRNENILPLGKQLNILVVGPNAEASNLNCYGSSETFPTRALSIIDGLREVAPQASITSIRGCDIAKDDESGFAEAVAAALQADVVIFAGGLDKTLEGEQIVSVAINDRESTALPAIQQSLIRKLHEANPALVVVLQSGGIVSLADCIDEIPALVYSFYGGQEAGLGIADVLFGDYNPGGRLPMTMPISDSQLPEWNDIYVTDDYGCGYRWFQHEGLKPQFAFGFGLSYTSFSYSNLNVIPLTADNTLSSPLSIEAGTPLLVTADITNTGQVAGEEVAQLYVARGNGLRELRGFERIHLQAGETCPVAFFLHAEDFYEWDVEHERYIVPTGTYNLYVGPSSDNLPLTASLSMTSGQGRPDIKVTQIFTLPRYPKQGDRVSFYAFVKNQGNAAQTAQTPMELRFTVDGTYASHTTQGINLEPGQGTIIYADHGVWKPLVSEDYVLSASLTTKSKEWRTDNNSLSSLVHVHEVENFDGIDDFYAGASHDKQPVLWYDLSGRRIAKPTKRGIYIMNGQKVLF